MISLEEIFCWTLLNFYVTMYYDFAGGHTKKDFIVRSCRKGLEIPNFPFKRWVHSGNAQI